MMSELKEEENPFMCIEVDEGAKLNELSDKFDKLFPERIIRLIINKEYSSFFYLGNKKWAYKNKIKKLPKFECKIMTNELAKDFLEINQLLILESLNIDINNLKVVRDIKFSNTKHYGMIFTDGLHYLIDQYLFDDAKGFVSNFSKVLDFEIILDILNDKDSGMILIKANKNILGEKNDSYTC